ncbi:hypothetical protein ACQ86N_28945 [Puia sp. P3]|uniref:hypothetical protein n=1 Tax=Puia sp. P3 TaxID=3423952 RepID=UPI003D6736CC
MSKFEEIYHEAKSDKWFKGFAVFCRIALAVSFIPTGIVKILSQRFAEGLPHNNPLGHYFDALLLTGYYYNFLGWVQVVTAILLLIPRTALLGALLYFPIITNICVLTYAVRFDGTRMNTMAWLACLFLLVWDYDRLKPVLSFKRPKATAAVVSRPLGRRLRLVFFGGVFAVVAIIIFGTFYLFELVPGNEEAECRNQCASSKNPAACQAFCDCIYEKGQPLDSCLANFDRAPDLRKK